MLSLAGLNSDGSQWLPVSNAQRFSLFLSIQYDWRVDTRVYTMLANAQWEKLVLELDLETAIKGYCGFFPKTSSRPLEFCSQAIIPCSNSKTQSDSKQAINQVHHQVPQQQANQTESATIWSMSFPGAYSMPYSFSVGALPTLSLLLIDSKQQVAAKLWLRQFESLQNYTGGWSLFPQDPLVSLKHLPV